MLQLYIGNKNYSSWSMRSWVMLRQAGIAFEEARVRFDSFDAGSQFKQTMNAVTPTGKVPVLVDGDATVWDTLAIAEYVAELYPEKLLWPADTRARARARSICAEMHSGFAALRKACPMNIEAQLREVGARMWSALLREHGGPLLFGKFTIADAFFAPVCMRLHSYGLPVPDDIAAYIVSIRALPSATAWIEGALAENDFRAFEEPYRAGLA
jgi:glutathione S-transferase